MNLILLKRRQIRRGGKRRQASDHADAEREGQQAEGCGSSGPPEGVTQEREAAAREAEGKELLVDLTGETAKHCLSVLRVQVGSLVKVGVFNGGICTATVVEIRGNSLTVQLERDITTEPSPSPPGLIDLLLAIPRPKTLDKILQICATMGVGRLLLVCSERVEKGYLSSPKLGRENIEKQIQTGLEQGVSTRVPEVQVFASWQALMAFLRRSCSPCSLHAARAGDVQRGEGDCRACGLHNGAGASSAGEDASRSSYSHNGDDLERALNSVPWCCLTSAVGRSRRLIAHPGVVDTLGSLKVHEQTRGSVLVAIGPEGGWLDQEVEELKTTQGFEFFSLGDRVLRCETAVVSVISQLSMLLQDATLRQGRPPPCAIPESDSQAAPVQEASSPTSEPQHLSNPASLSLSGSSAGAPGGGDNCTAAGSGSGGEATAKRSKKGRVREGIRDVHCDEDGRVIVLPQKFSQHKAQLSPPTTGDKGDADMAY
ncbi:RNA methyltransferase [Besnoitia besnoiti]|uniref:16S rRNA (uracil(1498)-N(3))-methyltransferase n=1 Tax=Besnoitia besnoiti TaxID=94643 RepID=A0A2A9M885_BESBE|nr:RNA methyltransferase [Besnoitia besnoiti]PFH31857.1 RNA methyltransferase [Besnoitia besnoiti]